MAETKKSPAEVMLRDVRLSYPNLWKAKAFGGRDGEGQGEPKFSAVALMDPTTKIGKRNIAKIEDAIDYVKKQTWPKGAPKLGPQKICLKDAEDLEEMKDGYEGMMYVTASDAKRPRVLDIDGIDVRDGDEGAPYAGCRVDMKIRVWGQDNKYGKRVNASLVAVKFRDDDDAFGAAPFDASEFDEDDDDDDVPRRSSKGRESDRGSRRSRDDDDEDEKPRGRRSSRDDDDEDEKPRGRRSSRDDDEEEEKPRSRRSSRDDDDEDEKPRGRRSSRDDDDGDERRGSRRSRDDDEEDEKPRSRRRSRDDDDDEDEKPRSRRRDLA